MTYDYGDAAACDSFHMGEIRSMQGRIIAHLAAGSSTDLLPAPVVVPSGYYTDPEQLSREKAEIFAKTPLLAGLSSDIPEPGDVMLFDEAGPAIVVTRDKSGKVHAFLNMCRHRGARVATRCGHAARLVCRFHGWSYGLDGKLAAIPGKEGFEGLDRSVLDLVRVPVAEWHGMIFVVASPGEQAIDVETHLGSFAPQVAMLRLADARPVTKSRLHTRANWKLMLDTHGEGYHFASLHPQTIAPNVISNVSVYDRYGPHYRVSFAQRSHAELLHRNDPGSDVTNYSCSMLLWPNTILFLSTFNLGREPGSIETGELDSSAFYYGIYRLFPGATPDDTTTLMASYRPVTPAPQIDPEAWRQTHDIIEKVLIEEDYAMAAEQHANLAAAPDEQPMIYGRNEQGIQFFHEEVMARTGGS